MPAKRTRSRSPCWCAELTVTVLCWLVGRSRCSVDPTANRCRGSSVRTSTTSSPLTPCGLTTRPTATFMAPSGWSAVGVHDVDPDAAATDPAHHGPQRGRRATAATDDLAEVVRVHVNLEDATPPRCEQVHLHLVRMVDDAAYEVFEGVREDAHAFSLSDPPASLLASAPPSASFGLRPDRFLGVVASVVGSTPASASAALNKVS